MFCNLYPGSLCNRVPAARSGHISPQWEKNACLPRRPFWKVTNMDKKKKEEEKNIVSLQLWSNPTRRWEGRELCSSFSSSPPRCSTLTLIVTLRSDLCVVQTIQDPRQRTGPPSDTCSQIRPFYLMTEDEDDYLKDFMLYINTILCVVHQHNTEYFITGKPPGKGIWDASRGTPAEERILWEKNRMKPQNQQLGKLSVSNVFNQSIYRLYRYSIYRALMYWILLAKYFLSVALDQSPCQMPIKQMYNQKVYPIYTVYPVYTLKSL